MHMGCFYLLFLQVVPGTME